jgi:hypothetical protein
MASTSTLQGTVEPMSHTYAILEVSKETFEEIHKSLKTAGYEHCFHEDREHGLVIDMHGVALAQKGKKK